MTLFGCACNQAQSVTSCISSEAGLPCQHCPTLPPVSQECPISVSRPFCPFTSSLLSPGHPACSLVTTDQPPQAWCMASISQLILAHYWHSAGLQLKATFPTISIAPFTVAPDSVSTCSAGQPTLSTVGPSQCGMQANRQGRPAGPVLPHLFQTCCCVLGVGEGGKIKPRKQKPKTPKPLC